MESSDIARREGFLEAEHKAVARKMKAMINLTAQRTNSKGSSHGNVIRMDVSNITRLVKRCGTGITVDHRTTVRERSDVISYVTWTSRLRSIEYSCTRLWSHDVKETVR